MFLATSVLLFASLYLVAVRGSQYEWIFDNDEIFESCQDIPGNNGIHDAFDLSEFIINYTDGTVGISGNITCNWTGVQPTDRIAGRAEVYKFGRGVWQPTTLTVAVQDFCKVQFKDGSIWHQIWTSKIAENDHKCVNNYGHIYHHQYYELNTVFDLVGNMEGRHKIVVRVEAFNEQNIRRPNTICFQIIGEFIKV